MDGIVSTFYRQTLFADFEYQAHQLALDGKPFNRMVNYIDVEYKPKQISLMALYLNLYHNMCNINSNIIC